MADHDDMGNAVNQVRRVHGDVRHRGKSCTIRMQIVDQCHPRATSNYVQALASGRTVGSKGSTASGVSESALPSPQLVFEILVSGPPSSIDLGTVVLLYDEFIFHRFQVRSLDVVSSNSASSIQSS